MDNPSINQWKKPKSARKKRLRKPFDTVLAKNSYFAKGLRLFQVWNWFQHVKRFFNHGFWVKYENGFFHCH